MAINIKGNMHRTSSWRQRGTQLCSMLFALLCLLASPIVGSAVADSHVKEEATQRTETATQRIQEAQSPSASLNAPAAAPPALAPRRMEEVDSPVAPIAPFAPFAITFPTQIPSILPPTPPGSCYTSIERLNDDEMQATDLDVVRNYVLCADTTFESGAPGTLWLRKNMHIYCGEIDGSSANNCNMSGGISSIRFAPFDTVSLGENVLIQGITFTEAIDFSAVIALPGDYTLIDCIFRDNTFAFANVVIEWDGGPLDNGARARDLLMSHERRARDLLMSHERLVPLLPKREERREQQATDDRRNLQNESTLLRVLFDNCRFLNNASGGNLALVSIIGNGTDVQFANCLFQNNDFNMPGINDVAGFGAIVDSFGSNVLDFTSTCWIGNKAYGNGLVTVVGEGAELPTVMNNFGAGNDVEYTVDLECEFVALYDVTDENFPNLECADFDSEVCAVPAEPTTMPSPAPVQEPTPPGACYTSLNRLDADERTVTDTSVVRNYVLCKDTVFVTSIIGVGEEPEFRPLTIRENMYIWCGEIGGSSENNCTIVDGTMLTAIPTTFNPPSVAYENVLIQGVTFRDSQEFALFIAGLPGDLRFVDCIFLEHTRSDQPILIDFQDNETGERQLESSLGRYDISPFKLGIEEKAIELERRGQNGRGLQGSLLRVDFIDCVFKDNGDPAFSLGLLAGEGIDVKFTNCLFENNNFNVPEIGFGAIFEIFSIRGAVEFQSNCFFNNRAIGNGLVVSYGNELPATFDNFGQGNEVEFTVELECEFVALVDVTDETFPNIACADFDASTCAIDTTPPPARPSTPAPIMISPAPSPIVEPTDVSPTMMGSEDMPTIILTGPDDRPVEPPNTELPTAEPSVEPGQGPTLAPVEPPSYIFTPAFTPNMITPSLFSPAMFSPVYFGPTFAMDPTYRQPAMETPTLYGTPVKFPSPSIESPEMSPTYTGSDCGSTGCDTAVVDKSVDVIPFMVKFVGDFELTDSVTFTMISTINSLIAPYLMGEVGEILDDIYLDMKFMDTNSNNDGRNLQADTTARMEVSGELDLKGDNEELESWNSERVTEIVVGFFSGGNLDKLISSLETHGLSMDEITTDDEAADDDDTGDAAIVTDEGSSATQDTDTNSNNNTDNTQESSGFMDMSTVVIASICAGAAFVVVAAALFVIGRRRRRRYRNGREMESFADSSNLRSGGDDLPDSNVSVAASHVSFPDVFNDEDGEPSPVRGSNQYAPVVVHDEYDDLLDDILDKDDDSSDSNDSARAVNRHRKHRRKTKRHHHRRSHDVEKASEWAKTVRKTHKAPLSVPQPRDNDGYDDYFS